MSACDPVLRGNDACSASVFELDDNDSLVGLEPGSPPRTAQISRLRCALKPKFKEIITSKPRTEKAKVMLGRLLAYMTSGPDVMSPRYQRLLLNEYIPLFSALFPPGKFETASLKQWLTQSYNLGIS